MAIFTEEYCIDIINEMTTTDKSINGIKIDIQKDDKKTRDRFNKAYPSIKKAYYDSFNSTYIKYIKSKIDKNASDNDIKKNSKLTNITYAYVMFKDTIGFTFDYKGTDIAMEISISGNKITSAGCYKMKDLI